MFVEVVNLTASGASVLFGTDAPQLVLDQAVSDQLSSLIVLQQRMADELYWVEFFVQLTAFGICMLAGLLTWALVIYFSKQKSLI